MAKSYAKYFLEAGRSDGDCLPIQRVARQGDTVMSLLFGWNTKHVVESDKVNEKGTVAAASTFTEPVANLSRFAQPPKRFIADHPFIFLIRDIQSGTILFMGRYTHEG